MQLQLSFPSSLDEAALPSFLMGEENRKRKQEKGKEAIRFFLLNIILLS